jgi:hypothetical protein
VDTITSAGHWRDYQQQKIGGGGKKNKSKGKPLLCAANLKLKIMKPHKHKRENKRNYMESSKRGKKNEGTTFSFMTFDTNTVNNKIGDY